MMSSPYEGVPLESWPEVTEQLVSRHPLSAAEIVEVARGAWNSIFDSRIGEFRIGKEIMPKPQIMGFLLHELIPLELKARYPDVWRPEATSSEKDLVCMTDEFYSVEIKTSSHPTRIFGNRSYAQPGISAKKSKDGYYLAINFSKFATIEVPIISRIRFGWIDAADWRGQRAASGQQASLPPDVESKKL